MIIITAVVTLLLALYFFANDISVVQSQTVSSSQPSKHQISNMPTKHSDLMTTSKHTNHSAQANTQLVAPPTTVSPIDRIRAIQERTQLQESILKDHETFNRYPEGNAAIVDAEHDPVLQRYDVDERTTMSSDKSKGLTIWSDKKFYLKTETVKIFAYIQDSEGNKLSSQFAAQLIDTQQRSLAKVEFKTTGNNTYEANINLADFSSSQLNPGIYKVHINSKEHEITDAITFTLSQPDIELTGEFKEHINSEGKLVFEVQVQVGSSNQYYIQGSLYSATQVSIGVSQDSLKLDAGRHWVALSYSGLMIKDSGESGPYVLKNLSLAKVTIPMMRTPLLQPGFTTDSYGLDEFK